MPAYHVWELSRGWESVVYAFFTSLAKHGLLRKVAYYLKKKKKGFPATEGRT
jgi:hypothetical protein